MRGQPRDEDDDAAPPEDAAGTEPTLELLDLREVVVEHRHEIFRFARSFTTSDADAEDLAQSALLRAIQRGPIALEPERAKWYVLRIVRNLATDAARSRARVSIEPWADPPERFDPTAVDDRLLRDDDLAIPRAAFADLPERHREVLALRFLEDLGYDDVAERLEVTEQAARQRVYRAMQELRSRLGPRSRFRPT